MKFETKKAVPDQHLAQPCFISGPNRILLIWIVYETVFGIA